jgi:hypothetical protein
MAHAEGTLCRMLPTRAALEVSAPSTSPMPESAHPARNGERWNAGAIPMTAGGTRAATHASLRSIPDAVAQFAAMTGRTPTVMIKKRA